MDLDSTILQAVLVAETTTMVGIMAVEDITVAIRIMAITMVVLEEAMEVFLASQATTLLLLARSMVGKSFTPYTLLPNHRYCTSRMSKVVAL